MIHKKKISAEATGITITIRKFINGLQHRLYFIFRVKTKLDNSANSRWNYEFDLNLFCKQEKKNILLVLHTMDSCIRQQTVSLSRVRTDSSGM